MYLCTLTRRHLQVLVALIHARVSDISFQSFAVCIALATTCSKTMYEDSPMDILSTDTCILLSTDIHGYTIFLYLKEFLILIFHLYFYT